MQAISKLRDNIQSVFVGNDRAVDSILTCLLAQGHILIEDVPGVGKTLLATALARSLHCSLSRIQLTPDMLPSDVLGLTVWDQHKGEFIFKPGPIFSNIVLADEINRTTPRTQSALLEAMNEAQVSMDGITHALQQPFLVIATQNPFEFEGTYFLPESQMDRFMMRIHLGYPEQENEIRILELQPTRAALPALKAVMTSEELIELQSLVPKVRFERSLLEYIVEIANATRRNEQLQIGISPRGTMAMSQAARARAVLLGRDYVIPEDISDILLPVGAHRIVPKSYKHAEDSAASAAILQEIIESVGAPASV